MPLFIWMSVCIWQYKYLAISESACDFTQMDWLMPWFDIAKDNLCTCICNSPLTSYEAIRWPNAATQSNGNLSCISWQLSGINKILSLNYYCSALMNHGIKAFTSKVHINCRVSYVCNLQDLQLENWLISQQAFTLGSEPPFRVIFVNCNARDLVWCWEAMEACCQ